MIRISYPKRFINSGALMIARRRGKQIYFESVAASAATHVSPQYAPPCGEAPRVYGSCSRQAARIAWLEWLAERLGIKEREWPLKFYWGALPAREYERRLRRWIEEHLEEIPER